MTVSKNVITVLLVVAGIAATGFAQVSQDVPVPYLGQGPPGSIPEVFAPGIVSGPYDERMLVFADGGTRLLYQLRGVPVSVIVEMRATDGDWSSPQVASFSGRYFSEFGVAPDGRSIVLTSNRPLSGSGSPDEVFHAYRVVRSDDGDWSEPEYLGENLDGIGHPSIAASGNLYFFRYHQSGIGQGSADLYMSMLGADGYGPPVDLGSMVNSEHYDVDPYVAPDESYLIFASNREPAGLYVSFRRPDGGWTDARYMGDELAAGDSICPWVSPDGRYLFFTSRRTSAYGVPEQPLSYHDKLTALRSPGNGSNDIYWVDASILDNLRQEVPTDEVRAGRVPIAQIFAPGVISSSGDEAILAVAEDGNVCYLTRSDPGFDGPWTEIPVLRSERRVKNWSKPTLVGSPGEPWYLGYREAELGEEVYFAWTPNLDGTGAASDIDIWSVEKASTGWLEPKRLPSPINLAGVDSWPVATDSGALYFFSNRPGGLGEGDLYRVDDPFAEYPVVEHLGDGVNSSAMDHDPCVAPDESFLVFASDRPGGFGGNDLYVSSPSPSGGWDEPINLGPGVNSEFEDARPVLSSDGEMLFFTRQSAAGMDVYRVPSSVVTAARLRDRSGPYLGETPPGATPQVFASGIVNTSDHEGCAEFSRSGTRFLFHRLKRGLEKWTDIPVFLVEVENGTWSPPRPAPFESEYQDWDYHFTPDGRWLYFTSMRPVEAGGEPPEHGNIWKVEITESGWGEPELLPPPINGPRHHDSSPTLTNDGTIYFFSSRDGGFGRADIYRSRMVDGDYLEPENLGPVVNTEHSEYDLVIAPDESFLVFSSTRPGGFGDVDLYVSFRSSDDRWSEPKNLGPEINATGAVFPSLTDDGKYLFFQSRPNDNGTVYWVSAEVIHNLR